jgi:hypothetical protein
MQLTEDQRNKLLKREELSPTERRDNEFAVRNKLKEFLEFVPDVNLILSNLPKDQLKKNAKLTNVLNDQTTYGLFDLVFQLLNLLDFPVAYGTLQKPYAIKESNYTGPYAAKYAVLLTKKVFEERNRIETKTYPKLKQMTPENYKRILYINEYIQALIDNYLSDLNMLKLIPLEMTAKKETRPDVLSFATLKPFEAGNRKFNTRLIKAIEEFGPISESELMLKLFVDPSDTLRYRTFSYQLLELEFIGVIQKDAKGWRRATELEQAQFAQKHGVAIGVTVAGAYSITEVKEGDSRPPGRA